MAYNDMYMTTLTQADLIDDDVTAVLAGVPIKLGEYLIPAGMELALGFARYDDLERASGRLYIELKDDTDTAAVENGKVRLSIWSPQDRPLRILYEGRTEIAGASTARNLMVPLPESVYNIREDQKLVLEFISDESDNIVKADCTIYVDCTIFIV